MGALEVEATPAAHGIGVPDMLNVVGGSSWLLPLMDADFSVAVLAADAAPERNVSEGRTGIATQSNTLSSRMTALRMTGRYTSHGYVSRPVPPPGGWRAIASDSSNTVAECVQGARGRRSGLF